METPRETAPPPRRNWMYWLISIALTLLFLTAIDLTIGYETISRGFDAAWKWFTAPTYRTVSETEIVILARGTPWERIEETQAFLKDNGKLDRFVGLVLVSPDSVRIVLSPAGHPR